MLAALVRIFLFVLAVVVLLKIKKTRFRHVPARRTRIARRHGESTLWLERLVNAILDMLHHAVGSEVSFTGPMCGSGSAAAHRNRAGGLFDSRGQFDKEATEKEDDRWRSGLVAQVEERVRAVLEDRGIAAWADLRVHSVGRRPPHIKAIYISKPTFPAAPGPASVAAPLGSPSSPVGQSPSAEAPCFFPHAHTLNKISPFFRRSGTPTATETSGGNMFDNSSTAATAGAAATSRTGATNVSFHGDSRSAQGSPSGAGAYAPPTGVLGDHGASSRYGYHGMSSSAGGAVHSPSTALQSAQVLGGYGISPSAIEIEAEVEYAGGVDVSLRADIAFARGRRLPVFVHVKDVKFARVHLRILVELLFEAATIDTAEQPYLHCTCWLESDPVFDMQLHTCVSRYRVENFFLFPLLAKFLLLRFVRTRMLKQNGEGVRFTVPLPRDTLSDGESWWNSFAKEAQDGARRSTACAAQGPVDNATQSTSPLPNLQWRRV